MSGIFLIIFLLAWSAASVGLGSLLSKFFKRFTTNTQTGAPNGWQAPVRFLMIAFVFLLPVLDQLIAYPKWQQLCATTGDFEWGPGMDENRAFGREVIFVSERVTTTTIFPNIKIDYTGFYIYDAKTQELIFKKPHYQYSAEALFYIPSGSGNKTALFLPTCESNSNANFVKTLQLNQLEYKAILK